MSSRTNSRKKQKKEAPPKEPPEAVLWTRLDQIPPVPPKRMVNSGTMFFRGVETPTQKDANAHERSKYRCTLENSLLKAVETGNIEFVRGVITKNKAASDQDKLLCLQEHDPTKQQGFFTFGMERPAPVQPSFGFQDFIYGGRHSLKRANLLIEAIQKDQLNMVKELVRLGFDINASFTRNCTYYTSPLVVAAGSQSSECFDFLLQQPHIILTHPDTKVYPHGNGRSRPRCTDTALSKAAKTGNVIMVQKLIEKGALEPLSTKRSDDPCPKLGPRQAEELVRLSLFEAMLEAYEQADPRERYRTSTLASPERTAPYCEILEMLVRHSLLSESPLHDAENPMAIYVTDRIQQNDWSDISSGSSMYSYHYQLDNDFDFDRETGAPRSRACAIVRGLRTVLSIHALPNSKNADGSSSATATAAFLPDFCQKKASEWSELVAICRERLKAAGPDWKRAVEKALVEPPTTNRFNAISRAMRQTQMLYWCNLFTAPWSKGRHFSCYPLEMRFYIRDILRIGSWLDRRHKTASGAFKEVWDREIVPFIIA